MIITQTLAENESYFEQREMLDVAWGRLFHKIDILPIVLPYECDFKSYFENIEIDGVLLSGGNDLNSLNQNKLSQKRDSYELSLIDHCVSRNIPLFGVCRGMQIIAKYFDASFKRVQNQVATHHKIRVDKNSRYFKYLTKLKEVNSFHNFAIKSIKDDFLVSAISEDGVVKAIEHKELKVFAQMWHSERVSPFNQDELNLIKEFFQ